MISVIVNFYNNRREAQNTLHSLSANYQHGASDIEYEVIAVDNGSPQPLNEQDVCRFGPNFHYRFFDTQSPSPVEALNAACADAQGDELLIIIDGAHLLSPGILALAEQTFGAFPAPVIATVPFHLGPKSQNISVTEGYSQEVEDNLLVKSGWKSDGYRLFDITGSYADGSLGWFGCLYESGCVGMRKRDFLAMGGYDQGFQSRGGGLANLDFFQRAIGRPELQYVMLLGEATFHQVHGGVASNAPKSEHPWDEFHREYTHLRGVEFARVLRSPVFMGALPLRNSALKIAQHSAQAGLTFWINRES